MTHHHRLLLDAAIAQAEKSLAEGGIPIGSALGFGDGPNGGQILAVGHNLRVQTGDPTAHAETVCLRSAGRRTDWHTLTLATTLSPCAMCAGTCVLYRIKHVVIGEHTTFMGREDWLEAEGIQTTVAHDQHCTQLMQEFISNNPTLWNEDIGVPE